MDWVNIKRKGIDFLVKYRLVFLIALIGVFLMSLPESEAEQAPQTPQLTTGEESSDLQVSLEQILGRVAGAGEVEVLLTQAAGEQTIYQVDDDRSEEDQSKSIRRETVLITNSAREETGLVQQVIPPVYQGAIILCQGADSAQVRLAIVGAVANATGLTSDKISVLKMK